MRRFFWMGCAAVLTFAHCTTPSVTSTFGVFVVTLIPDWPRVTISGPNGPLIEGLDGSDDVGTPVSQNDDAPPMTGFAVRDVTTQYTMLFGQFRITDAPNAPWRVSKKARWAGGSAPLDLLDEHGAKLATLAFDASGDPNHLVVDVEPGDGPERRFSWGFDCAANDHFLGFGAQTLNVDARGDTIPIWLSEQGVHKDLTTDDSLGAWFLVGRRHGSYMPMPEYLSSRGYFAVAETNLITTFSMCGERSDVARMQLEMPVKVHLFYGPGPADSISRMTNVFGRPRVPPAFAFAPWNDAIFGSTNVRAVAKELRDSGIPSSVIWTEDWRGGGFPGDVPNHYALKEEWDVDRTLYPDFEAVAQELHGEGFKWLVYFNTFVEQQSKAWPETAPNGYLIKDSTGQPYIFADGALKTTSMVDLTNPAAVAWAVGKMQAAIKLGADGWMGDFGEWLPTDATLSTGPSLGVHSQYPVLWQQAQRQAMDTVGDGIERLSFVRSGWFGSPPLVDVWWAGDQQTDWGIDDGLPTVLPIGLGVALSGLSTYGSDVAGYQGVNSPGSTKELFFRWTEVGALSPVMRTHHGAFPASNWKFDSDSDTLAHWTRYAKLHIALAPYLRTLAQSAHDTGLAIMRPLGVAFPDDGVSWPIADEYMLGPSLLVAPVITAGATSRGVYLPPSIWFSWAGGAPIAGGTLTADVPMSELALYAPAGAIVPTYPDGVMTLTVEASSAPNASTANGRIVYAFSGANGSFAEAYGGPSFTLTSSQTASTGDATASWNGSALSACTATPLAPCVQANADGVRAYVTGAGALVVTRSATSVAELAVATQAPNASFQLVVRF